MRVERRLGLELSFGRVSVDRAGGRVPEEVDPRRTTLDLVALDLPETTFETEAIWYLPEPAMLEGLETMPRCSGRSTRPSIR